MTYWLRFKSKDGTEKIYNNCVAFTYKKEAFMPYTSLTAVVYSNEIPDDIIEVKLNLDGHDVHHGFVDSYKVTRKNGITRGVVTSRGFTALLTENQLPSGMYSDMTFNRLFDEYITFPNIEHEDNSQSNYIYVKKGASIWDSVANLSYRVAGVYPYIYEKNTVMMSMPAKERRIDSSIYRIESYGTEIMTRRLVSRFNMADIAGEYGTYWAESAIAAERSIIRQRHSELDERFLSNPDMACQYKRMMAERDYKRYYMNFFDYSGQDLNDILESAEFGSRRINAVKVVGGRNGTFTEVSMYDSFPPVE